MNGTADRKVTNKGGTTLKAAPEISWCRGRNRTDMELPPGILGTIKKNYEVLYILYLLLLYSSTCPLKRVFNKNCIKTVFHGVYIIRKKV